ncbi:MAG TPA: ATP-binding protein, partial [Streptomyces sp.]|nr:ATP-binding protein [Streptomyces sp.]
MEPNHRESDDQDSGGITRAIPLIAGEYLLTINPVDGSEIEPCPPGEHPGGPRRRTAESRAERERTAVAPVPTGVSPPEFPLLERAEERARLARLLRSGRSVRLTGPRGSGRSTLLAAVAAECADLAPDGVIRLSGCQRTSNDLLYELFDAVHDAPRHRPDRAGLLAALRGVGAVVLLDDVEFGGTALDALLEATPECAFLISATPDTAAPSPGAPLEEVSLSGISRAACRELVRNIIRRPLTEEESNWVADLWFESEGLPLRFVQAGALLRQRDEQRGTTTGDGDGTDGTEGDADTGDEAGETAPGTAFDIFSEVFPDTPSTSLPEGISEDGAGGGAPLPALAEGAAVLLAAGLSETAREVLRFAVALGGVLPHPSHLPALVDDAHADTALAELLAGGLVTAAGTHHRLAAGVAGQLAEAGYDDGADARARAAAQHYAWWTGHLSVTPERVAREAEAVLAALQAAQRGGHPSAAVLLARTAAPVLAASLYWNAWERVLRGGQEAARTAGEVAEEAYFHHDLGVLALCTGNLDRARAELEASIGLRGALADRRGTVAGRRALALVEDRSAPRSGGGPGEARGSGGPSGGLSKDPAPPLAPSIPSGVAALPGAPAPSGPRTTGGTPALDGLPSAAAALSAAGGGVYDSEALTRPVPSVRPPYVGGGTGGHGRGGDGHGGRGGLRGLALPGARRNVLAAGAGALLAAAVGTAVTLGMASSGAEEPAGSVNPSVSSREDEGITVDDPLPDPTARVEQPGPSGTPEAPDTPSPSTSPSPEEESATASEEPEETPSSPQEKTSAPPADPTGTETPGNTLRPNPPPSNGEDETQEPPTPTQPTDGGTETGEAPHGGTTTASGPAPDGPPLPRASPGPPPDRGAERSSTRASARLPATVP